MVQVIGFALAALLRTCVEPGVDWRLIEMALVGHVRRGTPVRVEFEAGAQNSTMSAVAIGVVPEPGKPVAHANIVIVAPGASGGDDVDVSQGRLLKIVVDLPESDGSGALRISQHGQVIFNKALTHDYRCMLGIL